MGRKVGEPAASLHPAWGVLGALLAWLKTRVLGCQLATWVTLLLDRGGLKSLHPKPPAAGAGHSYTLLLFLLYFCLKKDLPEKKFESQGTLSIWCMNLSNVGAETLMDRWMEGTYGFLKPKYLFSFQDLSLGKNNPPFQNLRRRIYFNICRRILIFSFSSFSLAN